MISINKMRDELGGLGYPLKDINLEYVHKKACESEARIIQERLEARMKMVRMEVMHKLMAYSPPEELEVELMEYFDRLGGTAVTISPEEMLFNEIVKDGYDTIKEINREDQ